MQKVFNIILICLLTLRTSYSQSFEKIIATSIDESTTCTLEDSDAFYVAGISGNFFSGQFDGVIYKISKAGDTLKSITI